MDASAHGDADAAADAAPPCAVAHAVSAKDEDRFASCSSGLLYGYGVYDGHGGQDCAEYCASDDCGILQQILLNSESFPSREAIADVFWRTDAVCGSKLAARGGHGRAGGGAHAGATATILLVERIKGSVAKVNGAGGGSAAGGGDSARVGSGDFFRCVFAWVGDSAALEVDMRSGKMGARTINHTPGSRVEAANLRLMATAAKALPMTSRRQSAATDGDGAAPPPADEANEEEAAEEEAVTPPHVGAALKRAGVLPTAACPQELLLRAFVREQLINASIPKGRKYRRNALLFRRPRAKDENQPMVVATHEDPYSSHYRDLLMTRSICDWTKSAWVLPHPEVVEFHVPAGKHVRAVLASDGLWDVCDPDEAAEVLRAHATPQQAADALLAIAKRVYCGERGLEKMGDDTTVMVVDLLPGGPSTTAPRPPPPNCALS